MRLEHVEKWKQRTLENADLSDVRMVNAYSLKMMTTVITGIRRIVRNGDVEMRTRLLIVMDVSK